MSRIYEALRRAEAEKAASEQAGGEAGSSAAQATLEADWAEPASLPAPALEDGQSLAPPVVERSVALPGGDSGPALERRNIEDTQAASLPAERPAPIPAVAFASPHTEASTFADNLVDLDSIASAPWNPVLEHLPAVRERGRTVEQFRSLRSRMQEYRGANRLKSILVTSGLPQEGKSFVAVNLAVSLARHKISRVLLIDGDMRRSSLHKVLGCPNDGPGLTEYLSGEATLQQIMRRATPPQDGSTLPLGFASLVFIGAGKEADKAADLSGNHRFDGLIATVAPLFDWVIVDSSPVNLVADGVNLARACDGVLLIARGQVTKFETAQQAVAALEASKVLGFVLNAVNNSFASSGYYDYDSTAEAR